MAIFDLFSKRQKVLRGEVPDVYTYDSLPDKLRVQIVHIWRDALGCEEDYRPSNNVGKMYKHIVETICREYGIFNLPSANKYDRIYLNELANYFLDIDEIEKQLDIIEQSFIYIDSIAREHWYLGRDNANDIANSAIDELNSRFKEHGVGFQYLEGEIVRVDSELIHTEVVKPALRLLNEKYYQGAQQEFLNAFEHYRHGRNKESLNDCLKAFESTMKSICEKRNWSYQPEDTAKLLIRICFQHDLIPSFWQDQLNSLRNMLESGIPTGRNKLSGHGQGSTPTEIPYYLVAYMLHMTASTLVFLTSAEKELK